MNAVGTHHVVTVAWVGEEVGIGVGIDAGAHEGQRVLGHTDRLVTSLDDHQTPFEPFGLTKHGGAFATLASAP